MVYAGIVDITPSPFKHFQGCHESTQVYSGRMGVAPAVAPHWEWRLGLELHYCICDFDQRLFRFQSFDVDAIDLDVAIEMGLGLECGGCGLKCGPFQG